MFPCVGQHRKNKMQPISSLSECVEEETLAWKIHFNIICIVKSQTSSQSSSWITEQSVEELQTKLKMIYN